jgi:hypothetical protein
VDLQSEIFRANSAVDVSLTTQAVHGLDIIESALSYALLFLLAPTLKNRA